MKMQMKMQMKIEISMLRRQVSVWTDCFKRSSATLRLTWKRDFPSDMDTTVSELLQAWTLSLDDKPFSTD